MSEPTFENGYWLLYDAKDGGTFRCPGGADWRPYVKRGQFQTTPPAAPIDAPPVEPTEQPAPIDTQPAEPEPQPRPRRR